MIRPVTIATFLMACGSGLYLYQSKHEVQVLDRTIEQTVRETASLRNQSRDVATEWTMLNDPERLRQFNDEYLHLTSIDPKQFTSLAELGNRLPPPEAPASAAADPTATTSDPAPSAETNPPEAGAAVAEGSGANDTEGATAASDSGAAPATGHLLPAPPMPAPPPTPAIAIGVIHPAGDHPSVPHIAGTDTPPQHHAPAGNARLADVHPTQPIRVPETRPVPRTAEAVLARPAPRVASMPAYHPAEAPVSRPAQAASFAASRPVALPSPRPMPQQPVAVAAAPRPIILAAPSRGPLQGQPRPSMPAPVAVPAAAPYGGSLLGMAHGAAPQAPRPTPVNAYYNAN